MSWDLFTAAETARGTAAPAPLARGRGELWSVAEVNAAARELIEGVLPPLWVSGEVTGFTRARSGHCYFSLRDATAQLRCVMWRTEAARLPTVPTEGMAVRALGHLTLYEARGEFQLSVAELEGRGEGLWKLAFDRLRARLATEGLTADHRKRAIPRSPACVGVVTSLSGAALRDILSVIRRRAPWTEIVVCGCRVQGDGAAAEIAAAVRRVSRLRYADVLIVGRGGGSREDLWAFNDELVARALAECEIPTISAVGHETDFTIADLVADLRAPTPSAAAEAAVADAAHLRSELGALAQRVRTAQELLLEGKQTCLAAAGERIRSAGAEQVERRRTALAGISARLAAASPLAAMARGFAVPLNGGGKVLRGVAELPPGSEFRLRVRDGILPCRVTGPPLEEV